MKRTVILLVLVAVCASLTGCRRGLFGCRRNRCAPPAPTYAPVCPPTCPTVCPPTACQCPPTVAPTMPCQCAPTIPATTVPGYSTGVPSYSTGVGTEYVVPGSTIQTVPMTQGSGTIYGGQLPLDGQFGMTVVGDRIVGPSGIGKVTAPVKVGQK